MMRAPSNPIFCALDTPDVARAAALAEAVSPAVGGLKLGKEFFTANGPGAVRDLTGGSMPLFLDLKFHDIPNTVAGGVRSAAARLKPFMLTVHCTGGPAMLRAAVAAAAEFGDTRPLVLGVTVLTSLDDSDLAAIGVNETTEDHAHRLALLARDCGVDGLVCSPREIVGLRQLLGPDVTLVVPGIRPLGTDSGDQKRTMGPAAALAAGADYLVIGRPITGADSPAAAAADIAAEIGR